MSSNNIHINKNFSETIEMMRFPLIVLVVFAHMVPFATPTVNLSANIDDIYVLVSEMISHNLAQIAVPTFFVISSFFFFRNVATWDWSVFGSQLKKKARTLLIPYVIWNVVLIVVIILKSHTFDWLGWGIDEGWLMLQSTSWYELLWEMPVNFPLWFVRDLICMTLLSPLFYMLFKWTKEYGLILLGVIYLAVWETSIPGLSSTAILFFGAGVYLAIYQRDVIGLFKKNRVWIAAIAVLILLLATVYSGTSYHVYMVRMYVILGVISTINLFDYLRRFTKLKQLLFGLAPTTFFIYVAHEIYIINWLKGALLRISESGWVKLVGYFVVPFICIVICIGLYYLLTRLFPRVMTVALGGRLLPNVKKAHLR